MEESVQFSFEKTRVEPGAVLIETTHFRLPIIIFNANRILNKLTKIIFYRFTMEVETKQLYFFVILTALSLKINASPVTEDEIDTTLGRDGSVDQSPNIKWTTRGKEFLLVTNHHNGIRFC